MQLTVVAKEKLERYLDVTRAGLFFARRVIFVEGAAELALVHALALKDTIDLRNHGVSLISVEGMNFDSFLPLFGKDRLEIPVAVITDADPGDEREEDEEPVGVYPALGAAVTVSANTQQMMKREDEFVGVFHGVKTLEYDLALHAQNRESMLTALGELHPAVAKKLRSQVDAETGNAQKAKALFRGMFERKSNNVQKGRYAQTLAQVLAKNESAHLTPDYIKKAIKHVTPPQVPAPARKSEVPVEEGAK